MFKPIGNLLPEALSRLKVRKPVEATVVCRAGDEVLSKLWDHAVPMRAISFRSGVVTVAVTGSAWAHEVSQNGERAREAMNAKLGRDVVKSVKTRVAPTAARGEEAS